MSSAGFQLVAGRIPGERIATTEVTANSSAITTTETSVMSVTAAVVSGRTYRVTADFGYTLSTATDSFDVRIRQDSAVGTQEQRKVLVPGTIKSFQPGRMESEFTAGASENKTFHLTFDRDAGAGSMTLQAAGSAPSYMYVDFIR